MTKSDKLLKLKSLGQSIWYDNLSRELLEDGSLKSLLDTGILGVTSNPAIFEKAISSSSIYDQDIKALADLNKSDIEIYEELAIADIQSAADILFDTYLDTNKTDGFVSLEVNPHLAHDTSGTILEAKRLYKEVGRPNLMIKVPATKEGIPAIEHLIGEGISVNVTLIFSLESYKNVVNAYKSGIASVDKSIKSLGLDSQINMGASGVANGIVAYKYFRDFFYSEKFNDLLARGARVQRPLWASTAVKDPALKDVFYVEELIGSDTVNTLPDVTLNAFIDHGIVKNSIDENLLSAANHLEIINGSKINIDEIMDELLVDGVKIFADAFDQLIDNISRKRLAIYSKNV